MCNPMFLPTWQCGIVCNTMLLPTWQCGIVCNTMLLPTWQCGGSVFVLQPSFVPSSRGRYPLPAISHAGLATLTAYM